MYTWSWRWLVWKLAVAVRHGSGDLRMDPDGRGRSSAPAPLPLRRGMGIVDKTPAILCFTGLMVVDHRGTAVKYRTLLLTCSTVLYLLRRACLSRITCLCPGSPSVRPSVLAFPSAPPGRAKPPHVLRVGRLVSCRVVHCRSGSAMRSCVVCPVRWWVIIYAMIEQSSVGEDSTEHSTRRRVF